MEDKEKRRVRWTKGLWKELGTIFFLSHWTLKIRSSINKPVSGSKILEKWNVKKREISNHGWLENIFYCINQMDYHFNVFFFLVQTDAFLTVYIWCRGLVTEFFFQSCDWFRAVERIAARSLPHSKRLDNMEAKFHFPCQKISPAVKC